MAMRIKNYQSSQRPGALPAVSAGPLAGDSAAFGGNGKSPAAMQRFAQAAVDLGDAAVKARENELALQLIKAEQEDRSAWERFRGEIFTPSGTPDTGLSPGREPPSLPQQAEEFWDRLAGERMAALGRQHPTAERYIVNTWWPMRENAVAQATEHAALQDRARRDALFTTELDSAAPILANPDTPPETRQTLHTELARKTRGIFANANPPQLAELEAFQTLQESAAQEARVRNHRDGVFAELSALPETEAQARLASPEGRKALALSEGDAEAMRGMLRARSVFDAQQEEERKNAYSAQLAAKIGGLFKSGSAAGREGPDGQAEEGAEAREPAPLAAYRLMLGADIAPHVRDAALARITDGSFGKTDDAEAKATLVFGLAAGTLAEHAVDEAMLCGALTPGTADGLRELGKSLRGENGIYVAQGFAALQAQLPPGTAPEQQAKAQEFLQRQLAQAAKSGRVPEALDPKNPANAVAVSLLLAGAAPASTPSGPEELARDVAGTQAVLTARHAPLDDSGAYAVAGLGDTALQGYVRYMAGQAASREDVPKAVLHGGIKGLNAAIDLGYDAADWLEKNGWLEGHIGLNEGEGGPIFVNKPGARPESSRLRLPNLPPPETRAGQMAAGISQYMVGFKGVDKLFKGIKAASAGMAAAKGLTTGAVTDFAFFDGQEERLSNLIQSHPSLANPINEYLAAKPGDGKAEGRLKNTLEGLGVGMMAEGLTYGLRLTKVGRELTQGEMQRAEQDRVAQKQERAAIKKEGGKIPPEDYTDYRSPDTMHFAGKERQAIQVTDADRLYVGNTNRGYYVKREANDFVLRLKHDHNVGASAVESIPGSGHWQIKVDSVPSLPSKQKMSAIAEELFPIGRAGGKKKTTLGIVGPEDAARIKAETGINCLLHKRTIAAEDVFHALDRHGSQARLAGEPPLSVADFAKYEEIVREANVIKHNKRNGNIIYEKRYPEGTYTIIEQEVGGNSFKFVNMWKSKTAESMRTGTALSLPGKIKGQHITAPDDKK